MTIYSSWNARWENLSIWKVWTLNESVECGSVQPSLAQAVNFSTQTGPAVRLTESILDPSRPSPRANQSVHAYAGNETSNSTQKSWMRPWSLMDNTQWPQNSRKIFPEFSRLFQSHKLTFPQVIATKSKCNNHLHQGSFHINSSNKWAFFETQCTQHRTLTKYLNDELKILCLLQFRPWGCTEFPEFSMFTEIPEYSNARFLKFELSWESRVIPGTRNSSVLATANLGLSSE